MNVYAYLVLVLLLASRLEGAGYPKDADAKAICEFSVKFLEVVNIDGDYKIVELKKGHEEVTDSVVWFVLLKAKDSHFVQLEIGLNKNEVFVRKMKEEGGRKRIDALPYSMVWQNDKWVKNP